MLDVLAIFIGVLDSLPNFGRTMLSASLFAGLLCFIASRLPTDHVAVSVAFRKATLLALSIVPMLMYLVMNGRLVLVVDDLPGIASAPIWVWWIMIGGWAIGVLWSVVASARANWQLGLRFRNLESVDEKLAARFAHWQKRLELTQTVRLGFAGTSRPLSFGLMRTVIVLPRAIAYWPVSIQDVMLLGALAHIKRGNLKWLRYGEFISALYWPLPWVRELVGNFNGFFEHTSDSLAATCYQDRIGYQRGLTHAEQRLQPDPMEIGQPTHLGWGDSGTLDDRQRYLDSTLRDPSYDRVFWSILPAVALVVLLTGTTLEKYIEIEAAEFASTENWEVSLRTDDNGLVEVPRNRRWIVIHKPRKRYYVPDLGMPGTPSSKVKHLKN